MSKELNEEQQHLLTQQLALGPGDVESQARTASPHKSSQSLLVFFELGSVAFDLSTIGPTAPFQLQHAQIDAQL